VDAPTVRVHLFSALLAGCAAVLVSQSDAPLAPLPGLVSVPWPALAAAFLVAEIATVQVAVLEQSVVLSLTEIPLVVGLLLASPIGLIGAWLLGSGLAQTFALRRSPSKVAFNLAKVAFQAATVVLVYRLILGHHPPLGPWGWLAAICAVLVGGGLAFASVAGVISLVEGRIPRPFPLADGIVVLMTAVVAACLSLLGIIVAKAQLSALGLLFAAGALVFLVLRSYAVLRKRHQTLQALYTFTRQVNEAPDQEARTRAILSGTREILRVDEVALAVPDPDGGLRVTRMDPSSTFTTTRRVEPPPAFARVLSTGRTVAVSRSSSPADREVPWQGELASPGLSELLVAPLSGRGGVFGLLTVANRVGSTKSLGPEEREFFEVLAGHAGVNIDNDRLVERLRQEVGERAYEATHDALTGLANRALLTQRMGEVLEADDPSAALLLIDLDRFKEVNDTLGHHHGDLLLCQAAARLRALCDSGDLVARLGGDEFAVLMPGKADRVQALEQARLIGAALQAPYPIGDVTVEVAASVGVVTSPSDGLTSATLLQRADVAMYRAKAEGAGVVAMAYDPAQDHHSRRRLSLAGELRLAVEEGGLDVVFQPIASLADGRVTGVEALVRWSHPTMGTVSVDDTIATAERTGLIWPLTQLVLSQALAQCARWRARGLDLDVQVNLSPRSLHDAELGAKIRAELQRAGVPPEALTLEITESSLVTDVERSVEVLERLRSAGVLVAIDDFGVGHASLTYLRRLPCDVIKLDRSFVKGMSTNRTDRIIVSSTIVLAHSLRLQVVAEGVGDAESWTRLRILGCNAAQGHFVAPALPGDEVEAWLADWEQRRLGLQALRRRRTGPAADQAPAPPPGQEPVHLPADGPAPAQAPVPGGTPAPLAGQRSPVAQDPPPNGRGSPKPPQRPARVQG